MECLWADLKAHQGLKTFTLRTKDPDNEYKVLHTTSKSALIFYTQKRDNYFIRQVKADLNVVFDLLLYTGRGPIFSATMIEELILNAVFLSTKSLGIRASQIAIVAMVHFLANDGTTIRSNFIVGRKK